MNYSKELQTALDAARQAGRIIMTAYAHFRAIPDAPADITTDADRQSQETILKHLLSVFPNDAFCAEENTPTLATALRDAPRQWQWIVDPIDGTRGFAQKNGEFSVMVALRDGDRIVVGVVFEPVAQRLTYAVAGEGCWSLDADAGPTQPCRVSSTQNLHKAILVQSRSRNPAAPSGPARTLQPAEVRETHSAGLKLAMVARGEVDLYVNTYTAFHDWDIAAGHILVSEAGGNVTGLKGQRIRYNASGAWQHFGLLATNGCLHHQAVHRLVQLFAED
jgi:3'(2'), 5'-bisphosphate nucleotidase